MSSSNFLARRRRWAQMITFAAAVSARHRCSALPWLRSAALALPRFERQVGARRPPAPQTARLACVDGSPFISGHFRLRSAGRCDHVFGLRCGFACAGGHDALLANKVRTRRTHSKRTGQSGFFPDPAVSPDFVHQLLSTFPTSSAPLSLAAASPYSGPPARGKARRSLSTPDPSGLSRSPAGRHADWNSAKYVAGPARAPVPGLSRAARYSRSEAAVRLVRSFYHR